MSGLSNMLMLFGGIFALVGFIQYRFPPKKRNHFYGYRTPASQRSQEAWDFAQRYSARLMIRLGLAMLGLGVGTALFSIEISFEVAFGMGIPLLLVALMIVCIERELAQQFPPPPKQ